MIRFGTYALVFSAVCAGIGMCGLIARFGSDMPLQYIPYLLWLLALCLFVYLAESIAADRTARAQRKAAMDTETEQFEQTKSKKLPGGRL